MNNNRKIAIYVRVSTYHQIDKDSLPLQRKDLINYCEYILGNKDYVIFEDAGYSAKNTDRPQYQQMMSRVRKKEFSHILVWKIDRISRNLLDFCDMYNELKKYDCTFISRNEQFDTSSAMGEAMLKIILVFAELERKLTAERVKAVMLDRASKGQWNGAPIPLGYMWDDVIKFPIPDPKEADTVQLIYNKYLDLESTSAVRNVLNELGVQTKRGGSWTTKTLTDVIRNPFYKGTYRYNYRETGRGNKKKESEWVVVEGNHEPLIAKDIWQKCNDIMDKNAERNNARFRSNVKTHIFSSLLECGECHNSYYGKQDKPNQDGFIPSFYCCTGRYNHLGCSQKTVSEKIIANTVLNFIASVIRYSNNYTITSSAEFEQMILKNHALKNIRYVENIDSIWNNKNNKYTMSFKEETITDYSTNNFEIDKLKKEQSKFERALQRLEDLYLYDDESLSEKDYLIKRNELSDKVKNIKKELSKLSSNDSNGDCFNGILNKAKYSYLSYYLRKKDTIDNKEIILDVGRDLLKEFINLIIDKIIVQDKKVTGIVFKNNIKVNFIYR